MERLITILFLSNLITLSTFLFLSNVFTLSLSRSILHKTKAFPFSSNWKIFNDLYCQSWRYTVETNNVGFWEDIPTRCQNFAKAYMYSDLYASDCAAVSAYALEFAKSIKIGSDGKDAWIFDVDETTVSNFWKRADHYRHGLENIDEAHGLVDLNKTSSVPAILNLYKDIQKLNFKVFILSGRNETLRNFTTNLLTEAGYSNWDGLILRDMKDVGKPATIIKSKMRAKLEAVGYRIHGNIGDQWSDLNGISPATRSFKLPNLMYHLS